MTFLSDTGTFSNVTRTSIGNNLMLDVIYDAHDVRVVVEAASVATPEPESNLLLLAGLLPVRCLHWRASDLGWTRAATVS
jgi:hypothetical protein